MPNQAPQFRAVYSTIERVSTNSAGEPADYWSFGIVFSPDGTRIAFASEGRNLVAGDNNNSFDVFVKNLQTGVVTRVSTNGAGGETGGGNTPVFLPGGDKIAFLSGASNLVAGDTNGLPDIFIKDLVTGAITRASTHSDGTQFTVNEYFSTTGISAPAFSPDGTKMAFAFHDGGGATVYIKDLITGTLTVAVEKSFSESVSLAQPQFSPDGTKLLYRSYDNTTGIFSLYLKGLTSGAVNLVSTNSAGQPANFHSEHARFSGDGTRIVFSSYASNLVAGDTNGLSDIFVKDLATGAVTVVSINAEGVLAGGYRPAISPDGSKVAFSAGNLMVPGDTNGFLDIVVKDLVTGEIALVSTSIVGGQSPSGAEHAVFSPDGTRVGFSSDRLVLPDTNGAQELYLATFTAAEPYHEDGPAAQIVPVAMANDFGSLNYAGGSLSVAITAGGAAGDRLTLAQSSAPGESIAISGDQVLVNNIVVGILAGTATSLVISFNANARNQAVELLTEAVRISSTSDDLVAGLRTVTFTLVDGDGTADGGQDTTSFSRKVLFVAVDEVPGLQLIGGSGPDLLEGAGGNDVLDGGAGADTLIGSAGNDLLDGGAGADELNGGIGIDTTDYAGNFGAVWIDLSTGQGRWNYAHGDALVGIENVIGTEYNDRLIGAAGTNVLDGRAGNDTLDGGLGSDVLDGGSGRDTADYSGEFGGVWIDLSTGLGQWNSAHGDTLSLIENVIGTDWTDWLTGNGDNNRLEGGKANDRLLGNAGNDVLVGGLGADVLDGGANVDTADYSGAYGGVWINFMTGQGKWNYAEGDILSGIEKVIGTSFADTFESNGVTNVFTGGDGNDTFVFRPGFSQDIITDFDGNGAAAGDTLRFRTGIFTGYDDMLAHASQQGADVRIQVDAANFLVLQSTQLADLHSSDFIFG